MLQFTLCSVMLRQNQIKRKFNYFYALFLTAIVIVSGIIALAYAVALGTTSTEIIHNSGRIKWEIEAKSGYWRDIQDAVDLAASLGISVVRIPEGTWNFVNVGESWTGARVVIPAGISIFGAPTERTSGLPYDGVGINPNDQVVEWKTVLVIPWDAGGHPSGDIPIMFKIDGNGDPSKSSRVSDIAFVGYREIDNSSTSLIIGILIEDAINFRVDHCAFLSMTEHGVWARGYNTHTICGVIDHCNFTNPTGRPAPYDERTVGYGVRIDRCWLGETSWDPLENVVGHYTNYTVFIENCYFSKWRHCVASNNGAHYVFRHNTIQHDFAYGSLDAHGNWVEPEVGTRAIEIYNNLIIDPVGIPGKPKVGIQIRGGGGCIFNNTVEGYEYFIRDWNESWNETYYPHDIYIWDNSIGDAVLEDGSAEENEDYFLYEPGWYDPFTYPHPLTST